MLLRTNTRIGEELAELAELPEGYRLFMLVDTGGIHVHIFPARRPPSVVLICGREGGMLRVVPCSFLLEANLLRKESVLRMEVPIEEKSRLLGWMELQVRFDYGISTVRVSAPLSTN